MLVLQFVPRTITPLLLVLTAPVPDRLMAGAKFSAATDNAAAAASGNGGGFGAILIGVTAPILQLGTLSAEVSGGTEW